MNKVILVGRLTKDIELRYTQTNNTAVASFTLAVDRKIVKAGEERKSDFINIVAWSKLAEIASKNLSKGVRVDDIKQSILELGWNPELDFSYNQERLFVAEMCLCFANLILLKRNTDILH